MNPFPSYTELPRVLPVAAWRAVRALSVAAFLALCVALWMRPAGALFAFWRVLVPLLPALFLVAPGIWRNVCPLAAANQAPRLFGFTRAIAPPSLLRERGYVVAIVVFTTIVVLRRPVFDRNGAALSLLLLAVIATAFVMGWTFKGKSGWCSSICPLLPVQRLYGQTPLVGVANTHCEPCIGCAKNCFDFNPGAAYQADLHDADPDWSAPRKLFAGAFPGIVVGFFSVGASAATVDVVATILVHAAVGAGIFFVADTLLPLSSSKLASIGAAVAATSFYWHQADPIAGAWGEVVGADVGWLAPSVRVAVALLAAAFVIRTAVAERKYVDHETLTATQVRVLPSRAAKLTAETAGDDGHVVTFLPGDEHVVAPPGSTLLEIAERNRVPIEAGCRMGVCGADPVAVLDGMENLSPVTADEAATLQRLGLGEGARMACRARVNGAVCVSTAPEDLRSGSSAVAPPTDYDPGIERVVVLGNGIAGVTAADVVRRNHPDCEIHVVGREAHHLYNRMGISRIIHGRSAMQGLSLLPDQWYDDNRITCWLNTSARRIDVDAHRVELATGEWLDYDRLVIATGSASFVPPVPGYGGPGTFVLREADDAVAIRRHAQAVGARTAVVAGAGLLGLEAAHALHLLGLSVTVVERGPRALERQADERASEILTTYMENLGVRMLAANEVVEVVRGDGGAITQVRLADGRSLDADLFLVSAGITPNAGIARDAGIAVNRGVLVDDHLRTSAPDVFAAGDVAEVDGQIYGLWPVAVHQATVAARNAVGHDVAISAPQPVALLKGVGLDLLSAGRVVLAEGDREIVEDDPAEHRYLRVVVDADGRVAGCVAVGRPDDQDALIEAVRAADHADTLRWLPVPSG